MQFDVLIVGGGPAGLSAALILGRCHRKALLCDEGRQRNLSSHAIHGLLGREGRSPPDFLDEALEELSRYKSVEVRGTPVTAIVPAGEAFKFVCADGTHGTALKVLLATGLVDELPELGSNPSTGFRCITVSTATVSNMPGSRWPPMARVIRGRAGHHDKALDI
jgi:thioredoxin reductase